MYVTLYKSKEKGIHWVIDAGKSYHNGHYYPFIYLLPTIEFVREFCPDDEDNHNSVEFRWLIWHLGINKYWGEIYKR